MVYVYARRRGCDREVMVKAGDTVTAESGVMQSITKQVGAAGKFPGFGGGVLSEAGVI